MDISFVGYEASAPARLDVSYFHRVIPAKAGISVSKQGFPRSRE
jgi:hypothetical protein